MNNTRLMSRLFSATEEKDEELTAQVGKDIEDAKEHGVVDTEELKYEDQGDGSVAITDKGNGEVTIAERSEDGNYELYPAELTQQIEGFIHPEGDGVTPGQQVGAPDEYVENHLGGEEISEQGYEGNVEETAIEGPEAEDDENCPNCGKNPCECEEDKDEEKEFSVSTDNMAVIRIFNDQAFCERIFSEVIDSEETAKVGNLKIEKVEDEDNTVIVTDEVTGDQAKVTMDDEEMEVTELDSKNFSDDEFGYGDPEQYEALRVVGVDPINHTLVDAEEYEEDSAKELADRLSEQGVDSVEIFDNPEDARDYAIDLLDNLGVESVDDIEEPEEATFSDHTIYLTRYYSSNTVLMDRMFSEAENDIEVSQNKIEDAIESGEEIETDDEVVTPIDSKTAIVEDKENDEYTKVTLDDDEMNLDPISEDEAKDLMKDLVVEDTDEDEDEDEDEDDDEEEKTYSDIYCDKYQTKFFSRNEYMTDYMCRLFSDEADEEDIVDAIENGEEIEQDNEIITPIDANTAVIEDKENGEFTKAVLDEDKESVEVNPISEDEAEDLMKDIEVDKDNEVDESEFKEIDTNGDGEISLEEWKNSGRDEEEFKEIDTNGDGVISLEEWNNQKSFSDIYCDEYQTRFFSENEYMTDYMCRLFSEEADEKDIEKAIENGEEIETDSEIITPVDANTAVIEDKENGEFTKAVMDDETLDVNPISEDEAEELTEDVVADKDNEIDESEFREIDTNGDGEITLEEWKDSGRKEEEFKNIDTNGDGVISIEEWNHQKSFSTGDYILDKFFADAVGVPQDQNQEQEIIPAVVDPETGQLVPADQANGEDADSPQMTVEAIEDKAVAAVQSIQAAAAEAEATIMNAKAAPVENQEQNLQEAQFSSREKYFSNTEDTLVSWLNGTKMK